MSEHKEAGTRVKWSGNNDWYTPEEYIEAARLVLGVIELDPASSDVAQESVKAESYYTIDDDGLVQDWNGKVWLNPPYARQVIDKFVDKLVEEYLAGNVKEAILLTNNSADTRWWHLAASESSALVNTRGRIKFLRLTENGAEKKNTPPVGQTFFYFGPNARKFIRVFEPYGIVLRSRCS